MLLAVDWQVPNRNCAPGISCNIFFRWLAIVMSCPKLTNPVQAWRSTKETQTHRHPFSWCFGILGFQTISNYLPTRVTQLELSSTLPFWDSPTVANPPDAWNTSLPTLCRDVCFFKNKEVWTELKGTHMIGFKSTSVRAYQVRVRDLALNQSQKSGNLEIKWNEYANLDGYHLWLSEVFFGGRIPATLAYTFLSELARRGVYSLNHFFGRSRQHLSAPKSPRCTRAETKPSN